MSLSRLVIWQAMLTAMEFSSEVKVSPGEQCSVTTESEQMEAGDVLEESSVKVSCM